MPADSPPKSTKDTQPKADAEGTPEVTADQKSAPAKGGLSGKSPKSKPVPAPKDQRPTKTEKIGQSESQFRELEDKYVRLRAEYDNHIKRTNKEKGELISHAGSQFFRLMLPILDDLKRTTEHALQDESSKDHPVCEGLALIVDKFTKVLEAEGVEIFNSVGEDFDPDLHEALMTRPSSEHPPGIVLEEFESGYRYREKVLRHAKVVVSG
jgi:molecular chaperone GrpE